MCVEQRTNACMHFVANRAIGRGPCGGRPAGRPDPRAPTDDGPSAVRQIERRHARTWRHMDAICNHLYIDRSTSSDDRPLHVHVMHAWMKMKDLGNLRISLFYDCTCRRVHHMIDLYYLTSAFIISLSGNRRALMII